MRGRTGAKVCGRVDRRAAAVRQRSARDAIGRAGRFPGSLRALIATSVAFVLAPLVFVDRAAAAETQYARPVTSRLNVTGRAIDLPVELKDGDKPLGEVIIRIDPDDTVLVHKAALAEKLALVIDESTRTRLEAVQGQARIVTTNALSEAGFDVRFDAGLQELVFRPTVEQRPTGEISMAPTRPQISANLARPAIMAGYINMTAGIDHYWGGVPLAGQPGREASTIGRLEFDSAFRLWNVVIENRALYKSGAEPSLCPMTIACLYDQTGGFKRQSSRLVYDRPEDSLRLTAGDLDPLGLGIQGTPEMVGVSLQKSPQKLNPSEVARPSGQSSFRIDRPSQVDILVNGVVLQRLQLRPGVYNIRDLPLATGANDVQLEITDDAGERRNLSFKTFFDASLLAVGKSEWALSAGIPSYVLNDQRYYSDSQFMGSGYYRYGTSNDITLETHAQGDNYVGMGGLGAITRSPWGVFGLRGATSAGRVGFGGAAALDWSLINFAGFTGRRGESFRLSAEYRSTDFRVPGEVVLTADTIPYLRPAYRVRLDGSYSAPLGWDISATIAGRYLILDDNQTINSPYVLNGTRYGADLTLSRALTPSMSGSLTLGYSNETYLSTLYVDRSNRPEFRIATRVSFRPDDKTTVAAGYDSLNRQADLSAYRSEGTGVGRWDVSVNVQQHDLDGRSAIGGAASYAGNRAEVRVAHSGTTYDPLAGTLVDQRSSLRVGSAIAFADGRVAVGAPIRGNGFAIVYPHESIASKEITVGSGQDVRARSDSWGPAVVTNLPAYQPSTIPIDVADLPVGYSLGAATFDIVAPYKAGYSLEVGSAYSVYAYGTLLLPDGAPVALLTGVARPASGPGRQVSVFTNAAGKFGAEGLAPGRWTIEMATAPQPTRYVIDIPQGTDGLFRCGTLRPMS